MAKLYFNNYYHLLKWGLVQQAIVLCTNLAMEKSISSFQRGLRVVSTGLSWLVE